MENATPMLAQYQKVKARYTDHILFYRLGDFYEMFFDDAKKASKILDLVLTSRGAGRAGKVPMCGIPFHSADSYIARLVKANHKVAICEQVEDPRSAKGIVKRDVVRVITSGTFIDDDNAQSRYLVSLLPNKKTIGVAFTDTISGVIELNQFDTAEKIFQIIARLPVYECIFPESESDRIKEIFRHPLLRTKIITLSPCADWSFNLDVARRSLCEHFSTHNLAGFGIDHLSVGIGSAGALLEYLRQVNQRSMAHLDRARVYDDAEQVFISPAAVNGLELESLLENIDHTRSGMGRRTLRQWVYHPLKCAGGIRMRQNAVLRLKDNRDIAERIDETLRNIPDIERSISRISCGCAGARDLLALRTGLTRVPAIREFIAGFQSQNELFRIDDPVDIRRLLERAVNPEVPLSAPAGKIIRKGFDARLDQARDIQENGRQWLKDQQRKEIEKTGIGSLKIGFNKVFGYYIEVSKANLSRVPREYIRKQTLVNAERFITPALKEFEENMLGAQEAVLTREAELLAQLHDAILQASAGLHQTSSQIGRLDALSSLSWLARRRNYILPEVTERAQIVIVQGRHPVIEDTVSGTFIANDTCLDCEQNHLLVITGPNMAGKSTYIRQVALLVILAQIGSFLPAESAQVGIVDKIFTRIGAWDDIAKGQSTFMVEMNETADILNNITERSLVILDEIGRGTSTYDGLSLAQAVSEYLAQRKVKTLFATHFHELNALTQDFAGVKNYNIAVKEWNDEVIFLHKIVPGGTDDSYGIYVAKLAGVPGEVVARAKKILTRLEVYGNLREKIRSGPDTEQQMSLFDRGGDPLWEKMKQDLEKCEINALTPLDALGKIHQWKQMLSADE